MAANILAANIFSKFSQQASCSLKRIIKKKKISRKKQMYLLMFFKRKWEIAVKAAFMTVFLKCNVDTRPNLRRPRSCRRLIRNGGWWEKVWHQYSEKRFKRTFRVTRGTFLYILGRIRHDIKKEGLTEEPVSPELRLAICLYRLGKGDYLTTIGEMTGIAESTACLIVIEVCEAIINNLWHNCVEKSFQRQEMISWKAW